MRYRLSSPAEILSQFDVVASIKPPIVVAEAKGNLVGFLATKDRDDLIEAGPFEARSPHIGYKLVKFYEAVLKTCGIDRYLLNVDSDNESWLSTISRTCERIDDTWYRRRL